MTFQNTM